MEVYRNPRCFPIGSTPERFAQVIKSEIVYYAKFIKEAGIKLE